MPRGVLKANLPSKICVTCERPFTWRKKWENCWSDVTTCSKSCNGKRKKLKHAINRENKVDDLDSSATDYRTKNCAVCDEGVYVAFRVRYDESRQWKFVCKGCWPSVSGRKSSRELGDEEGQGNPLYTYGGTWKSVIGQHKTV